MASLDDGDHDVRTDAIGAARMCLFRETLHTCAAQVHEWLCINIPSLAGDASEAL